MRNTVQKDVTIVEIRIGVPLLDVMKDEDKKDGTSDFLLFTSFLLSLLHTACCKMNS